MKRRNAPSKQHYNVSVNTDNSLKKDNGRSAVAMKRRRDNPTDVVSNKGHAWYPNRPSYRNRSSKQMINFIESKKVIWFKKIPKQLNNCAKGIWRERHLPIITIHVMNTSVRLVLGWHMRYESDRVVHVMVKCSMSIKPSVQSEPVITIMLQCYHKSKIMYENMGPEEWSFFTRIA